MFERWKKCNAKYRPNGEEVALHSCDEAEGHHFQHSCWGIPQSPCSFSWEGDMDKQFPADASHEQVIGGREG